MEKNHLKRMNTATGTTHNLDPSPGPSPCRNIPPPPASAMAALSPSFSRAPLRARLGAADAAAAAAASSSSSPDEHPCVTLWDWWLERVEGDERKIAVVGFTERNDAFTSAPIAKRYEPLTLEDEDGVVVLIPGALSISRMRGNGFSLQICEKFLIGFPYWWESWDSHMESQPSSSINSRDGSTQFYLEKFHLGKVLEKLGSSFIGNLLNNAKKFPNDDADAFKECPRFEEYTSGYDISTKEKSAASNDSSVDKEVDNVEIDLIAGSTSRERGHVDIECNVSSAPTAKCISGETYVEAGNQNDTMYRDAREQETGSHLFNSNLIFSRSPDHMPSDLEHGNTNAGNSVDLVSKYLLATVPPERAHCCSEITGALENLPLLSHQRTPVASLKNQCCLKRTKHIGLNQKVVPNEDTPTSVHSGVKYQESHVGPAEERRSAHVTRSPMIRTRSPYAHQSPLTRGKAKSLNISIPESLKMKRTRSGRVIVPPLDPGSEWIVYDMSGSISGVACMESPLKGSKSRTPARKKMAR